MHFLVLAFFCGAKVPQCENKNHWAEETWRNYHVLQLAGCLWGRIQFLRKDIQHRIPAKSHKKRGHVWQTVESVFFFLFDGRLGFYLNFCVCCFVTSIPADRKNRWQTVNDTFSSQEVGGVYLSIVYKDLQRGGNRKKKIRKMKLDESWKQTWASPCHRWCFPTFPSLGKIPTW